MLEKIRIQAIDKLEEENYFKYYHFTDHFVRLFQPLHNLGSYREGLPQYKGQPLIDQLSNY